MISLTQPWATLWVHGEKLIETRSWGTKWSGLVAVHAAQGVGPDFAETCLADPFASALVRCGYDRPEQLPRGRIVGVVHLVACLKMQRHHAAGTVGLDGMCIGAGCDPRLTDKERAFGNYAPGRVAWITDMNRPLRQPIEHRGAQGLRALPVDLAVKITEVLAAR